MLLIMTRPYPVLETAAHPFLKFAALLTALCICHLLGFCAEPGSPTVITAEQDWVPLKLELDIEPGSALDFSTLGFTEAPAGKHGRVIAQPDGQFAFADSPKVARRFYGVNLCFGAQYLAKEDSDRLAERLARIGYNAVRLHHYERDLVQGQGKSTELNPEKIAQLDYLVAALIRRGIYITTDLYVSRPVPYREIGIDKPGVVPMDTFKILVPVHAGAFQNWKEFSKALLGHTNAVTGRPYAAEPALAWIAMINEGNFGNFFKDIRNIPEWKEAWNKWLLTRYRDRTPLATAWGADLKVEEDPAQGSVALPAGVYDKGVRARDCILFLGDTERGMVIRMKQFLHDELHCHALVSNSSSWTRFTTDQGARTVYDYVDDHFYVDHPQFIETPWRLPSKSPNTNPISEGAPGGRNLSFTRLYDKPFTVTEYNYSGPGRFRAMGGILTGALGALQGWSGIWRFAYSHSRNAMFSPSPMGYFDVASDPLSQAAERASLCLFLRGDLQPAHHKVALVMTEADLKQPAAKIPTLAPRWHWLAWTTRVGTQVVRSPELAPQDAAIVPLGWATPASAYKTSQLLNFPAYPTNDNEVSTALRARNLVTEENSQPGTKYFRSETGEITIDGARGEMILDTPRTAGGYAADGQEIAAGKAGVHIRIQGSDATVWVTALDQEPIRSSKRLLVTHLTDLQNSEIKYTEAPRQTLLDWGHLPHLVKAGRAEVAVQVKSPKDFKVWALSPAGRRLAEIQTRSERGSLVFTADVAGDREAGARMLYEIAVK
jgi:hypothetical protein